MSEGKVDLYNLGTTGVELTKSVIHADDGSFRQAQNAVPDVRGEFGGIAKRDGLIAINSTGGGGSTQGIINVPLPVTRNIYFGREAGNWGVTQDEFSNTTTTASLSAVIDSTKLTINGAVGDGLWFHAQSGFNGKILVYPPDNYTQHIAGSVDGDLLPLRMWDGSIDREIARVPKSTYLADNFSTSGHGYYIWNIILDGTKCYFSTFDWATNATFYSRVFSLDTVTGEIVQIGNSSQLGGDISNTGLVFALYFSQGYLWAAVGQGSGDGLAASFTGKIYRIRPGVDTSWTLDGTFATDETPISIASYRGQLFVGTYRNDTAEARLMRRAVDGTWASVATSGGVPSTFGSRIGSLIVYNDALYYHAVNMQGASSHSKIRKWVTSVTDVHTFTLETGNEPQLPAGSLTLDDNIYFFANADDGGGNNYTFGKVAKSTNGTTFSEVTGSPVSTNIGRVGVVLT